MNRNSQHPAIILRISPMGEIHAGVDVLTRDAGLLRATAYGLRSRRGSLRGKVVPFSRGILYLYTDPRRESPKVTDYDVDRYAQAIAQDLTAFYHGNLWAEVIWRSRASGEEGPVVFDLLAEALDLMEQRVATGTRQDVQLLSSVFLWRYLGLLGLRPELGACASSDRFMAAEEPRFYSRRDGTVVAHEWAEPGMIPVPSGTARLLQTTDRLALPDATVLPVTAATMTATRTFLLAAIQDAIEVPLNTLKVAAGAL